MSAGLGLLQILGSGGEGYFGAKSENIRGETEKKEESRKEKALALREANLAKIRSMYKTEELGTASRLSAANQKESDIRKEDAAKNKFDREQGVADPIEKKYDALVKILGGDDAAKAEATKIIRSMESKEKKTTSSDKKYGESQALANLGLIGDYNEDERTLTVPCDANGVVGPETENKIKESGYTFVPQGEVDKIDRKGLGTGDDYFKTFKLGGWTKPEQGILGGTDTSANAGGGEEKTDVPGAPKTGFDGSFERATGKTFQEAKDIINPTSEDTFKSDFDPTLEGETGEVPEQGGILQGGTESDTAKLKEKWVSDQISELMKKGNMSEEEARQKAESMWGEYYRKGLLPGILSKIRSAVGESMDTDKAIYDQYK